MTVSTFQLSSIQQAVEVATGLSGYWYRGHSKQYGNLTPKVFRDKYQNDIGDFNEPYFASRFQLEAPAVYSKCPNADDHWAWLFLMQHHGCPTRLLDWSQSILVALYFAVSKHNADDGEIWAINPAALNKFSHGYGVVFAADSLKQVKDMAEQACKAPSPVVSSPPKSALAIMPPSLFPRAVNQLSRFTIHPRPQASEAITGALKYPHLGRYVIPARAKTSLHDSLVHLGITEMSLFADLDAVSKTVEYHVMRQWSVDPPTSFPPCDGHVDG